MGRRAVKVQKQHLRKFKYKNKLRWCLKADARKTSKSRDTGNEKSWGEQEPENLRLVLYDRKSSISRTKAGELNQSFQSNLGPQLQHQHYLEKLFENPHPQPIIWDQMDLQWEPGICFGLIWFLSFPNDSDPQLVLTSWEQGPLGSNHWDSQNHLETTQLQLSDPSSNSSPNLALSTVFVLFFLAVPCGLWDLSSPPGEP